MNHPTEQVPKVATRERWLRAHHSLLEKEKALTQQLDALAAERRRQPRERVDEQYVFETATGRASLSDLFDGRRQLIVYHHMLRKDDPSPCSGCCMVGDQIPHLAHLHARNTSLVFVSCAPIKQITSFRNRMGWNMPWVSTHENFNHHFGVTNGFGVNVFLKEGDEIQRAYFTSGRGVELLGTPWALLDLTPLGRQEEWEDSPEEIPQTKPYQWWRLHDEYEA